MSKILMQAPAPLKPDETALAAARLRGRRVAEVAAIIPSANGK